MALVRRGSVGAGIASDVKAMATEEPDESPYGGANVPTNFDTTVSTGSTLLDLTISGGRLERGGIPGGIIVEIFGPSGAGKSALLSELAASTQNRGGVVKFEDPEARLDLSYSEIYGISVKDRFEYHRPNTVSELFTQEIWGWKPPSNDFINMIAADSLAALSTNMEMEKDEGDKMGMRRAKEFSEGLRKTCRLIAENNWLIACSNQLRTSDGGNDVTPGGKGVPYYASLRISIKPAFPTSKIILKRKAPSGKDIEKIIGIYSEAFIAKSSVDDPYRKCPVSIIFGHGIDTVRDELQYHKDMMGGSNYDVFDRTYAAMNQAIAHIEEKGYERRLQDRTIEVWNTVQKKFAIERKPKSRM